jgi:hypothetical protein
MAPIITANHPLIDGRRSLSRLIISHSLLKTSVGLYQVNDKLLHSRYTHPWYSKGIQTSIIFGSVTHLKIASNTQTQQMQVTLPTMATLVSAIDDETAVENDLMTLCKWVREELFYVLIHDLKNSQDNTMDVDGPLCNMFVTRFMKQEYRSSIVNPHIHTANSEDMRRCYLRQLWMKGLSKETSGKGNIRKNLSLEKTAVYAALNDAFKSTYYH